MAKVIYVDDNASEGGSGSSWATAHKHLQDALATAKYGDEIWVAEGTYKPDQGEGKTAGDRASPFVLVDGVGMYGGFLGTETSRDPQGDNNQTILSGEIDENSTLWSLNVVSGGNLGDSTTFDGFKVTKGNANGKDGTFYQNGGGVYLKDSEIKISNCLFTNNSAKFGGGIYSSSSLTLTNCVFTNNSAGDNGGAIHSNSSLTLTNCIFTNNSAGYNGGGIHSNSSSLTSCVFTNNSAGDNGGGIHSKSSSLNNCVFTNNSAGYNGGGIHSFDSYSYSSSLTLTNCVFTNNSAGYNGGGIHSFDSSSSLTNCIFTNNSAGDNGGGIHSKSNSYSASHSSLTNCIFTNNSAGDNGGGIHSYSNSYSSLTLTNSILWKNSSSGATGHGMNDAGVLFKSFVLQEAIEPEYPGDPNARDEAYEPNLNILQGWEGDARAFDADPLFVNIDDPIGPDGVWFTDDDGLRLQAGSPAIDAGYNDALPLDRFDLDNDQNITEPIPADIAGYLRLQEGAIDLGAYEYGDELMPVTLQFTISASASAGGTVSGGGSFVEGTLISLTANPSNSDYIFSEWSGDANGSTNPLFITADAHKKITANFEVKKEFRITIPIELISKSTVFMTLSPKTLSPKGPHIVSYYHHGYPAGLNYFKKTYDIVLNYDDRHFFYYYCPHYFPWSDPENPAKKYYPERDIPSWTNHLATSYSVLLNWPVGVSDFNKNNIWRIELPSSDTLSLSPYLNFNVQTFVNPVEAGTVSLGGQFSSLLGTTLKATPSPLFNFQNWSISLEEIDNYNLTNNSLTIPPFPSESNITITANFSEVLPPPTVDLGNGWINVEKFGPLFTKNNFSGWMFKPAIGWIYTKILNKAGTWFFSTDLGWFWVNFQESWPFIYHHQSKSWLYHMDNEFPFYHYGVKTWIKSISYNERWLKQDVSKNYISDHFQYSEAALQNGILDVYRMKIYSIKWDSPTGETSYVRPAFDLDNPPPSIKQIEWLKLE